MHRLYKEQVGYDIEKSVVFLFNKLPVSFDDGELNVFAKSGDMPVGRQWGYLFGGFNAHTLAHELGHGKLGLKHTFSNSHCGIENKSKTNNNLMDYTNGDTLVCKQWEYLHSLALLKGFLQDNADGANDANWYVAHPDFQGECYDGSVLLESHVTYFAPSGLPFSLPKRVCKERNSGMLYKPYNSNDFIVISKKCLTSFVLDNQIYVAVVYNNKFLGYLPLLADNENVALKDDYTISNLGTIKMYDMTKNYADRLFVDYKSLQGFEGDYYAKGPIVKEDGDVLRCLKCLMPIKDCYCGKACVCFIDHSVQQKNYGQDCSFNRWFYGKVGIPVIIDGHLVRIDNYHKVVDRLPKPLLDQEYFENQLLDLQGLSLYYAKLGTDPPFTYQDVISNIKKLSKILAKTAPTEEARNIFKAFNKFNSLTNIYEALNREDYSKALYEAVKQIPIVGSVLKTSQSILTVIYSKEFMTAVYNSADNQIRYLYINGGSATEISEMEETKDIAFKQLDRIQKENNLIIHNRICTCH